MFANTKQKKLRIAVGLSGGVDSSVAAALLKKQGYEIVGVHMLRWDVDMPGCSGNEDRTDALRVAKKLDIPFRIVDFRKQYKEKVIDRFVAEYQKGRTPNPDIWCNEEIKFNLFLDYTIKELGVDQIATGHYVRVRRSNVKVQSSKVGRYELLTGIDSNKDQSYFLYRISQEQLVKSRFPLGEFTKEEVRELAKRIGLPTADKPDSVGVCFVGNIDVQEFLKKRIEFASGDVVDTDSNVIGKHEGVQFYTIGQRYGFEVENYIGEPLYVIEKDVVNNRLIVGGCEESEARIFIVSDLHWITDNRQRIKNNSNLKVRIRHLGELIPCRLEFQPERPVLSCQLLVATRGIAPGQHAVFYSQVNSRQAMLDFKVLDASRGSYDGEMVLGGGIIE